MKKIKVLFMITFVLLFVSCGKPREVNYDDTEERDGITYVKGESKSFTGVVKTSYSDMVVVNNYKNGKMNGICKGYYNGKLLFEGNYKDGKKDGIYKEYDVDGKLEYESNYKNGKLYKNEKPFNGIEKKYDENNEIFMEIPYREGEINGIVKVYSGKRLLRETPCVNGEINGIMKGYSTLNGKLEEETPYVNGEINGIKREYDIIDGKLKKETPYVNGEINGTVKDYDKNGELYSETSYVNGKKQGLEKIYTDGKLVEEKPYVNGEVSGIGEKNGKRNIYINDEEKREKIIKYAEKKLSYYLKDPTSYERISAYISGDKVHIRYRAKNSFGAYDIDEIDIAIEQAWIK